MIEFVSLRPVGPHEACGVNHDAPLTKVFRPEWEATSASRSKPVERELGTITVKRRSVVGMNVFIHPGASSYPIGNSQETPKEVPNEEQMTLRMEIFLLHFDFDKRSDYTKQRKMRIQSWHWSDIRSLKRWKRNDSMTPQQLPNDLKNSALELSLTKREFTPVFAC